MLYGNEIPSQDIKTEFHPFQHIFMGSSMEEIGMYKILQRWHLSFRVKSFEKYFFAIPNILSILQVNYSSSIYQTHGFKTETKLTEDIFRKTEQIDVLERVLKIYDKLIFSEKFLSEVDKTNLLRIISEILNEIPIEEMKISEEELIKRIKGVLVLGFVSGILDELTPEQLKGFDDAIKRRRLFK